MSTAGPCGAYYKTRISQVNPKAEFIGEQWPKLFEPDYTPYINAILAAKPDAVYCSLWGGDLAAFIKQAKPYGLFEKMKWVIPVGGDQTVMRALGQETPVGLLTDSRYYFYWPDTPRNKQFVKDYLAAYKDYPSTGSGERYNGIYFLATAMENAKSTDTEKVVAALEGLTIDLPRGKATLRKEDHQLLCDFMVGETIFDKAYPFAIGHQRVFRGSGALYAG